MSQVGVQIKLPLGDTSLYPPVSSKKHRSLQINYHFQWSNEGFCPFHGLFVTIVSGLLWQVSWHTFAALRPPFIWFYHDSNRIQQIECTQEISINNHFWNRSVFELIWALSMPPLALLTGRGQWWSWIRGSHVWWDSFATSWDPFATSWNGWRPCTFSTCSPRSTRSPRDGSHGPSFPTASTSPSSRTTRHSMAKHANVEPLWSLWFSNRTTTSWGEDCKPSRNKLGGGTPPRSTTDLCPFLGTA